MAFKGAHYIVLAVVVGLIAVFSINRFIGMKTRVSVEPTAQVVVADADISSGTALSSRLVKAAEWPQRLVPAQSAQSPQQVDGRVVNVPLCKGEPVIMSKLAPEGTAAGLGGLLREEMRAFTVRVDDVSGVAGFLHPGDHVDVLMALSVPGLSGSRDEQFSKIILQDAKVLTAGQHWEQNADNKPVSVSTVTLEVSPQQSEVLNLASTQGKIRMTLRSRANKTVAATEGVLTSTLINGSAKKVEAVAAGAPIEHKDKKKIEVIKGIEKTTATL
jgi:pilus assembly protein CpaB